MNTVEVVDRIEGAIMLAKKGRMKDAIKIFDENLSFTQNAMAMSYYALCLATVEKDIERAVSFCLMAIEKEFYNPDLYLNLGRICLLGKQKTHALKAFKKGLRFDNSHPQLVKELINLGQRRDPVISFLPRTNSLNRYLGILATRLAS